ncbi:HlyC/CorC family transporter [uncultured Cardiobacterium sp.]|uniref:HlyC/CorC family transporter n=1 Tax=uncultured Cardiobacterium sp. TaxID=417619 RepID=UPI0026399D9D|nr:HlyC/CorC family transporter [uncultured Cardiobacterium sp.]
MESIPLGLLILLLLLCLAFSAFFSASETAMMSLNRYKLKHQAEEGNKRAKRAHHLLKRPDRLIGTILLGNNFVNIAATSLGTVIGIRLYGDLGVLYATVILTVVILIFSEVAPKTYAALHAARIALPVAGILTGLVRLFSPLVALLNAVVRLILRPLGIKTDNAVEEALSNEELKSIVQSGGDDAENSEQQEMLLGVLELEDVTVSEAMVPRNELEGVDLNDDWDDLMRQITTSRHGRLVAYRDHLDQVEGMLHIRDIVLQLRDNTFDRAALQKALRPCIFVPENTPLRQQLLQFRRAKARSGLVVDEYGDIQGLITLQDILTHIVGDIGDEDTGDEPPEIVEKQENLYTVEGGIPLRQLNRELGLKLPLDGPNTLSGLIIETLGNFPEAGTELDFPGCRVRVLDFADGIVGRAEITRLPEDAEEDGD